MRSRRILRRPAGRGGARRPMVSLWRMGGLLQLLAAAAGAAATSGSAWRCAAGAGAGACWTRGRAGAGARAGARAPCSLFEFTLRGRTAPRELVAPQHEPLTLPILLLARSVLMPATRRATARGRWRQSIRMRCRAAGPPSARPSFWESSPSPRAPRGPAPYVSWTSSSCASEAKIRPSSAAA